MLDHDLDGRAGRAERERRVLDGYLSECAKRLGILTARRLRGDVLPDVFQHIQEKVSPHPRRMNTPRMNPRRGREVSAEAGHRRQLAAVRPPSAGGPTTSRVARLQFDGGHLNGVLFHRMHHVTVKLAVQEEQLQEKVSLHPRQMNPPPRGEVSAGDADEVAVTDDGEGPSVRGGRSDATRDRFRVRFVLQRSGIQGDTKTPTE